MAGRWLLSLLVLLLCSCCFCLCASEDAEAQTLEDNRQRYNEISSGVTLVDVSCADNTGKSIKWRSKGENDWKNCDNPLGYYDYTVAGADQNEEIVVETLDVQENGKSDNDASASICLAAYSLYTSAKCNESCKTNHENEVAFTMSFTTDSTSEGNKRWTEAKGSSGTPLPAPVASGVCTLAIPSTQPDAVPPARPPATPAEGKGSQSAEQQTERQGQETNKQPETNGNVQTAEPSEQTQEVAPAPKTHEPVKGEHETEPRSDEKDTQPENSVEEAASPESHPPAKTKEESDSEEEEEKPSVGGEQEARPGVNGTTVDVEEEGNENSNEPTTPSGIDDRGNASSSGTDGASTRDENNVSNTDTNHPSPDANNEEALGSVEPAPGVRRQGNANSTATSSRSNRTSADSNNVTNSVLHLTNNDSTARESASHVFLLLLLFLGLYEVVALC